MRTSIANGRYDWLRFWIPLRRLADPSTRFKRLHNELWGLWKHREGHVRLVAHIERNKLRVLLLKVGRRDEVYKVSKAELKRFAQDIDRH